MPPTRRSAPSTSPSGCSDWPDPAPAPWALLGRRHRVIRAGSGDPGSRFAPPRPCRPAPDTPARSKSRRQGRYSPLAARTWAGRTKQEPTRHTDSSADRAVSANRLRRRAQALQSNPRIFNWIVKSRSRTSQRFQHVSAYLVALTCTSIDKCRDNQGFQSKDRPDSKQLSTDRKSIDKRNGNDSVNIARRKTGPESFRKTNRPQGGLEEGIL
jgi:hypothetical protein